MSKLLKVTQLLRGPAKTSGQVYVILEPIGFASDHRIYMFDARKAIIYLIPHDLSSYFCRKGSSS